MSERESLNININYSKPLELKLFTESMLSVERQYKRFLKKEYSLEDSRYDLCINEIKQGSIDLEFVKKYKFLIEHYVYSPFLDYFKKKIKSIVRKEIADQKNPLDAKDVRDVRSVVSSISNDNNASLHINVYRGSTVINQFAQTGSEAAIVEKACGKLLNSMENETEMKKGVLLYWKQASDSGKPASIDKGIIEELSDKKLKIICINDKLKQEMVLDSDKNPFNMCYIVDVVVKTIEGKPEAYVIHKIHKKWERGE